jgi:hypothetical protein
MSDGKDYDAMTTLMYETNGEMLMLIVSSSTFFALVKHAIVNKTIVYWRLILAAALMTTVYII